MTQQHHPGAPPRAARSGPGAGAVHHRPRVRAAVTALLAAALALTASGCTAQVRDDVRRGWLPGNDGTTTMTDTVRSLWVGSWVAALAVGVIVWGLTIWCVVRYRRRKGETGLPPQLRYNVPLEALYTIVPLFMVGVLFFYTARDQQLIEARYDEPAVNIEVVGKQWAWDFNYLDEDVYETSNQVPMQTGTQEEIEAAIPTLYMPVGQPAEITIHSRDVIHSFYVPEFSYKKDMIPGKTNFMSVTPLEEGTYRGKCAELCGQNHSAMLFNVKVVPQDEYDAQMASLRERGQTGALEVDLGPSDLQANQVEDEIGEAGGDEDDS